MLHKSRAEATTMDTTMDWMAPGSSDGLDGFMQLWVDGLVRVFGVTLIVVLLCLVVFAILGLWSSESVRRRFWCRVARRNVEVEFALRGLLPRIVAVKSCSAFEAGTAISCRRRCLDASFRRQWEPALPLLTRRGPE